MLGLTGAWFSYRPIVISFSLSSIFNSWSHTHFAFERLFSEEFLVFIGSSKSGSEYFFCALVFLVFCLLSRVLHLKDSLVQAPGQTGHGSRVQRANVVSPLAEFTLIVSLH